VIFDDVTESAALYGDTNVEATCPSFHCMQSDVVDVKRGMTATINNVAYSIERIAVPEPGVALVYLG
jgi:hypothetical protein